MRAPHFLSLAQMDDRHFITACRHGIVHITCENATARFTRDEFRRLAGLLKRVAGRPLPWSVCDGELCVTRRPAEDCELRMGHLALLLPAAQVEQFAAMVREALDRLEEILASGVWDREEPEEAPVSLLEQLRKHSFSQN